MVKRCTFCKVEKPLDAFYKNSFGRMGLEPRCKECKKNSSQSFYKQNPMKFKERQKRYQSTEKYKKWKLEYDRFLRKDPMFRLGVNLRGNMYHALKAMKGFRRWRNLVGYGVEELAAHLESKFTGGITWDNYGTEWHVDHVVPKSWFKYTSTDDPKFKECWALSNLQPKLKRDNQSKGNRFVG